MSATVLPLASKRRRPLPLPDSFTRVAQIFGLSVPAIHEEMTFTLQRRKEGAEIGIQQGKLWYSLSHQTTIYPPSFEDARKWMAAYAARYGYTAREIPRRGPRLVSERGAEE